MLYFWEKVLQNKKKRGEEEQRAQKTSQQIKPFLSFSFFFVTEGFQDLGAPIDPAFNCADIKKRGEMWIKTRRRRNTSITTDGCRERGGEREREREYTY